MIRFQLNNNPVDVDVDPDTPLLWVVRDHFKLKGSKFGCGMGLCGACTMHMNGAAVRTCTLPVAAVQGASITTIEGLGTPDKLHPLQQAWVEHSVPQCGYCQSGQLMSASALLATNPNPSDADIDTAMNGNICRCGTYGKIKLAIKAGAQAINSATVQTFDPRAVETQS
ncbi:MAG: (2Fe-2S)-binding protein [Porticoccaceae bacterium]|jgi:isoquinoline 1-oxidoreductase alpha subunit|nr:MAG: (2Fe-2S)-binding protein [SAR92 bacterium BACL16 MAG-120619-bin48]KRP26455.1 MAG: (2Fe-2S)-binding protein [SAR92 bacterium BACL16 MAG-120322-bin99]MDP4654524.1 (2Fe-2S)-binding protein [Alphaproteobacteria bacterium]MDP4744545.1 (2Fe-2S)-binding protein [Porticoccaceae bacterium]MDP4753052.1 (2Fe-2S)-binding protein [Porticoccaceae bacterium]